MYGTMKPPPGASTEFTEHLEREEFDAALGRMGIDLSTYGADRAYARMQHVAAQSGEVSTEQMRAIVDEVVSGAEILQGVAESFR